MLPSRLFRNTGLPPVLRSLITPHPTVPPTVAVQLRFRLGVSPGSAGLTTATRVAPLSTTKPATSPAATSPAGLSSEPESPCFSESTTSSESPTEVPESRLSLTFTCTVASCGHRSTHTFTKRAYEKGIVLIECPGCTNRHLIADHLGWFKDGTGDGQFPTVEDMVKARGEKVKRGRLHAGGVAEYAE